MKSKDPMNFLNENGLVKGKIPAGKFCQFYKECDMVIERCPVPGKTRLTTFSCALARQNSLAVLNK
jgi:hypothetical protein